MTQAELDPSHIMQIGMGFWPSKTLLSAVELELFTELGAEALTGEELGERLGLHPRGDLRLPRRARRAAASSSATATAPAGRYRNTPDDRGVPRQAQPGVHRRHPGDVQRAALPVLGRPHRGAADGQAAERGQAHRHARCSTSSTATPRGSSSSCARWQASRSATSRRSRRSSTSRGTRPSATSAAPPASSALILAAAPSAPALHELRPAGRRADREQTIAAAGLADRVTTASGDFFADPLPKADVITMGMILHDWNLEQKMHLIGPPTTRCPRAARSSRSRTSSTTRAARTRSG